MPWLALAGVVAVWAAARAWCGGGLSASDPLDYLEFSRRIADGTFTLEAHHYSTRFAITAPIALCFKLFGVSAAAALAWPVVCSLATLLLLFVLGRRYGDETTGLLAAGVFAVMPLDVIESVNVLPDPILTAFATASVVCFLRGFESERAGRGWLLLSGVLLWGAYSAKIVGALLSVIFLAHACFDARRAWRLAWVAAGTLLFLVPELLWYHHATGTWLLPVKAIEEVHEQSDGVKAANADLTWRLFKDYPRKVLLPNEHFGWFGVPLLAATAWMASRWRSLRMLYLWAGLLLLYLNFGSSSFAGFVAIPANTRYLEPVVVPLLVLFALAVQRAWRGASVAAADGAGRGRARRVALAAGGGVLLVSSLAMAWIHGGRSFTHLTAQDGFEIAEQLRAAPPARVYADARTSKSIEFAFAYAPPFELRRLPPADDCDYLARFEPGDVLVANWREVLKGGPLREFDQATGRALLSLPDRAELSLLFHLRHLPAAPYFVLGELAGIRGSMRRDERVEYFVDQEEPRGTSLLLVAAPAGRRQPAE